MEGLFSLLVFAGFFYLMMRFGCGAHMVHGHSEHEHGANGTTGRAIDPVCGMATVVDEGYTTMYQGRQYRFCSRACLDKFDAHPERYVVLRKGGQ